MQFNDLFRIINHLLFDMCSLGRRIHHVLCHLLFEIKTQVLELGDVHIVITDDKSNSKRTLVYERQTLPDMISSITDGRYREQKVRLLATYAQKDIAYIIEGDDMHESFSRANHSVSSAYLNMVYRDNIHLFFTKNVEQTSFFILSVCSKILSSVFQNIVDA